MALNYDKYVEQYEKFKNRYGIEILTFIYQQMWLKGKMYLFDIMLEDENYWDWYVEKAKEGLKKQEKAFSDVNKLVDDFLKSEKNEMNNVVPRSNISTPQNFTDDVIDQAERILTPDDKPDRDEVINKEDFQNLEIAFQTANSFEDFLKQI